MELPKDLEKYRRRIIWKKSRSFVFSFIALLTAIIFFGERLFPTKYTALRIVVYMIVLAFPFIFTRFPFVLFDSTYCGIVEKVKIKTTTDNDFLVKPNFNGLKLYYRNTIYLFIKTPEGKLIKRKVYTGRASYGEFINSYNEGDMVFHLYGTDTVVILPQESETHVQCAVCGSVNAKEDGICRDCSHTLIKNLEFAGVHYSEPKAKDELLRLHLEYASKTLEVKEIPHKQAEETDAVFRTKEQIIEAAPRNVQIDELYEHSKDDFATSRRNALLERKLRDKEQSEKREEKKQAANAEPQEEEKPEKDAFLGEFMAHFGIAALVTFAITYVAMPFLISIEILQFILALGAFMEAFLFAVVLFIVFFHFGKNEFPHKRVSIKRLAKCAAPAMAMLAPFWLFMMYIGNRGEDGTLPPLFWENIAIEFVIGAVVGVIIICFAYKAGINERDIERRDTFDNTNEAVKRLKRWNFAKCFLPFVNYYQLYAWAYDYLVNPEPDRKLKYFLRGVLDIIVGITAIEALRYVFYLFFPGRMLNRLVLLLSLHLVGCVIAFVAYFDNERHKKLMARYKDKK